MMSQDHIFTNTELVAAIGSDMENLLNEIPELIQETQNEVIDVVGVDITENAAITSESYPLSDRLPEQVESSSHDSSTIYEDASIAGFEVIQPMIPAYSLQPMIQEEINADNDNLIDLENDIQVFIKDVLDKDNFPLQRNDNALRGEANHGRFKGASWYDIARQQTVILAGLGGIGSWLSLFMSRIAPKYLYLYDADNFETHNMSGQFCSVDSCGHNKAIIASMYAKKFSNYIKGIVMSNMHSRDSLSANIMMCGFDSMNSRREYFNTWLSHVNNHITNYKEEKTCLFIDGRLLMERFQIFCIRGDDTYSMNQYRNNHLMEDYKIEDEECTAKQTSHSAAMIASYMTSFFINHCANIADDDKEMRRVPFMFECNLPTMTHEQIY
jgi:hypothetical protein